MEKKYNDKDMKILKKAYVDYRQLERKLSIDFGDTHDIEKVYKYIEKMAEDNVSISFTNVDLDLGYFDFYYNDMLLTISTNNRREVVKLSGDITISNLEEFYDIDTLDFEELEKLVFGIEKGDIYV